MQEERSIVLCPQCQGAGRIPRTCKDGNIYVVHGKPVYSPCPVCDGEGRLIRITTISYMRLTPSVVESSSGNDKETGLLGRIYKKMKNQKGP